MGNQSRNKLIRNVKSDVLRVALDCRDARFAARASRLRESRLDDTTLVNESIRKGLHFVPPAARVAVVQALDTPDKRSRGETGAIGSTLAQLRSQLKQAQARQRVAEALLRDSERRQLAERSRLTSEATLGRNWSAAPSLLQQRRLEELSSITAKRKRQQAQAQQLPMWPLVRTSKMEPL